MTTNSTCGIGGTSSSSYLSDVTYASQYNSLMNPSNLHYISALKGQAAGQLRADFNYLDLGCGDGTTLNMLAALYPDAHFSGIDFNEEHISSARRFASRTGLGNVEFFRKDFAELLGDEFHELDFISCFGTFSWISPVLQSSIMRFVGNALKPGGVFLVHYSASPGKAQIDPLWYLVRAVSEKMPGGSNERVRHGAGVIRALSEKGAAFFKQNPLAMNRVSNLRDHDFKYWAHEALTEWQALRHGDVSRRMQEAGLSFLGHANPELNHDELCVPEEFRSMLAEAGSVEVREVLVDYILNRGVRADVYIRKDQVSNCCSPTISDMPFGILSPDNAVDNAYKCNSGVVMRYEMPIFQDIINELKICAKTPDQLCLAERMASYRKDDISSAVCKLVAGRQVQPFARQTSSKTISLPERFKAADSLVQNILLSQHQMNRLVYIPYRESGQCIPVKPLDALVLSAMLRRPTEGIVDWAIRQLNKSGVLLDSATKRPIGWSRIHKMIVECHAHVRGNILPRLLNIGLFVGDN